MSFELLTPCGRRDSHPPAGGRLAGLHPPHLPDLGDRSLAGASSHPTGPLDGPMHIVHLEVHQRSRGTRGGRTVTQDSKLRTQNSATSNLSRTETEPISEDFCHCRTDLGIESSEAMRMKMRSVLIFSCVSAISVSYLSTGKSNEGRADGYFGQEESGVIRLKGEAER